MCTCQRGSTDTNGSSLVLIHVLVPQPDPPKIQCFLIHLGLTSDRSSPF